MLSITLKHTGGYDLFLFVTGVTVLVGSLMFFMLPRTATAAPSQPEPAMAG